MEMSLAGFTGGCVCGSDGLSPVSCSPSVVCCTSFADTSDPSQVHLLCSGVASESAVSAAAAAEKMREGGEGEGRA